MPTPAQSLMARLRSGISQKRGRSAKTQGTQSGEEGLGGLGGPGRQPQGTIPTAPGVLQGRPETKPLPATEISDKELLTYIEECRKLAWDARKPHEPRLLTNLAYYNDRQWDYWDDVQGRLRNWRENDTNAYRSWPVHNLIKPKIRKLVARTHASNMEVIVSPKTETAKDLEAAEAFSAIAEHVAATNRLDEQNLEIIRQTTAIGPVFRKTWIDWEAPVLMPVYGDEVDEQGNPVLIDTKEIPSGDIRKTIVPWQEGFPDPRSSRPEEWEWFIQERQMTLGQVRESFPETGMFVTPGEGMNLQNSTRALIDTIVSRGYNTAAKLRDLVTVREFWHLPSPMFPEGATVWTCEGVVLWRGPWIYPSLKRLPFALYVWERGIETPWGFAATDAARGPQDIYNQCIAILNDNSRDGDKLLVPVGSGLRHDSFTRGKANEVLLWDPTGARGSKPELLQMSGTRPETLELLRIAREDMAEILEVQPVSDGIAPSGVTAAVAIESLERLNRTASAIAIETFRQSMLVDTLITLEIAKDVYTEPAILSFRSSAGNVRDEGQSEGLNALVDLLSVTQAEPEDYLDAMGALPEQADKKGRGKVVQFSCLNEGRIDVDVRASAGKDPAQRLAILQDMAKNGQFAPENVEMTITLLEAMQVEDADKLTARLLRVLMRQQAKQDDAVRQAQEMKAQEAEAQGKAVAEAEAAKAQTEAAKAQAEAEVKLALAQQQAEAEKEQIILKADLDLRNQQALAQSQMQADAVRMAHERITAPDGTPEHEAQETPQMEAAEHELGIELQDEDDYMPQVPLAEPGEALEFGEAPEEMPELEDEVPEYEEEPLMPPFEDESLEAPEMGETLPLPLEEPEALEEPEEAPLPRRRQRGRGRGRGPQAPQEQE